MTATTTRASAPVIYDTNESELVVVLNPHDLDFSEYHGTRAQLEAEGVIPSGTQWPLAYNGLRWKSGKFDFWLRRMRPMGAKGARKLFIDCDYWCLRWELTDQPHFLVKEARRKSRELDEAIYRCTEKGVAEMNKRVQRYFASLDDEKFQAFKALIPWPSAIKRGRRAKNIIQTQGESA